MANKPENVLTTHVRRELRVKTTRREGFPGGPVVRTPPPTSTARVASLLRKLRSHIP